MKIQIISGSNRQGRGSDMVAKWVEKAAKEQAADVEFEVVHLADFDLPMMQEAIPPMGNKDRGLTGDAARWLETLGSADGYIIVTPEYNHGMPASLKNAIDTLDYQLMKKPVAIVSHGAIGGARANEQVRLVVNSNLGAVPVPASVTLKAPVAFAPIIADDGTIADGYEDEQSSLEGLVESTVWFASALKTAREA